MGPPYLVACAPCGLRELATTEFSRRSKDRLEQNVLWSEQCATGQSPMSVADDGDEGFHVAIAPNRHQGSTRTSAPVSLTARTMDLRER
jgi:hypothetical protein